MTKEPETPAKAEDSSPPEKAGGGAPQAGGGDPVAERVRAFNDTIRAENERLAVLFRGMVQAAQANLLLIRGEAWMAGIREIDGALALLNRQSQAAADEIRNMAKFRDRAEALFLGTHLTNYKSATEAYRLMSVKAEREPSLSAERQAAYERLVTTGEDCSGPANFLDNNDSTKKCADPEPTHLRNAVSLMEFALDRSYVARRGSFAGQAFSQRLSVLLQAYLNGHVNARVVLLNEVREEIRGMIESIQKLVNG